MRSIVFAVLIAATALTGCSSTDMVVVGVVVTVHETVAPVVDGFTMRAGDRTLMFLVGEVDLDGGGIPPARLTDYRATARLLRVTFYVIGGTFVATKLQDAG